MAPQSVSHMWRVENRGAVLTDPKLVDSAKSRAARLDEKRGASTKVTKVRQGGGLASILSTIGNRMFRRKQTKRAGRISPQLGRSVIARQRGYYAGASGVRGVGRDTGTVNPFTTSARGDASKIAPLSRPIPVGVYLPKVGG